VARKFLAELMDHKEVRGLLSDEHARPVSRQAAMKVLQTGSQWLSRR
jgi:hypothetical protein